MAMHVVLELLIFLRHYFLHIIQGQVKNVPLLNYKWLLR